MRKQQQKTQMEPLGGFSIPKDELRRVRNEVLKDLFERGRIENPRHLAELLSAPLENPYRLDKVMVAAHYEALLPDAGGLRISMGDLDVMRRLLEAQTPESNEERTRLARLLAKVEALRAKVAEEYDKQQIREAC